MKSNHAPHDPPPSPLKDEQIAAVRASLERILASPAFRNSRQCQKFLQYVVTHSLGGDDELLRERSMGIELFGRAPDYDTGEDPVVRVRATEVRKRLAQFYGESPSHEEVRFEMPSGSYRVEFHWQPVVQPPPPAPSPPAPRWIWVAVAVTLTAAVLALVVLPGRAETVVDRFWSPVLNSPRSVFIYCGQPVVYFLSPEVHERFRARMPAEKRRGSYVVTLAPEETVLGRDIVPVTDQFVGIGNAHTAAVLTAFLSSRGRPVELRYGNDISFTDLRNSPSVLIGAFSNLWTLEMTSRLRFVFEQEGAVRRIRDRAKNTSWQLRSLAPDGKTPEDYALVSRLFDSETGQALITAAGITQYGTRVAGEFLTDAGRLQAALNNAPADWRKQNAQFLLHTTIYRGTPAPPKVLAAHFW